MVREKIQEIVDFVSSESPYQAANKGWINEDVYIQWGKSTQENKQASNELVNLSIFWSPIQVLLSIIFGVLLISTIFVFSAVSFSNGRFDLSELLPLNASDSIQRVQDPVLSNNVDSESLESAEQPQVIEVGGDDLITVAKEEDTSLNEKILSSEPLPKKELTDNLLQPKNKSNFF